MPIKSPFSDATTHYIVEGPKVTFEQIELRAANMLMSGNGSLNFDTRRMSFAFTTDNPNWPKIPIVGVTNLLEQHMIESLGHPGGTRRTR